MSERLSTSDFLATDDHQENRITQSSGGGGAQMVKEDERAALFSEQEGQDFRSRWDRIQIAFVDEPRRAVEDADNLVATTMSRLAEIFADERKKLAPGERARSTNSRWILSRRSFAHATALARA